MSFTLKLTVFTGAWLVATGATAIGFLTPSFNPDGSPCYFTNCHSPAGGSGQSIEEGKRKQPAKRPLRHQRSERRSTRGALAP
jgi:hypothetical protein